MKKVSFMPQLVKGGKYVFGWSEIRERGKITIPEEAYFEYKFNKDKKGILMSGSKTSGGFGLSSYRLIKNSSIGKILDKFPELINYSLEEGEIIKIQEKIYCWTIISKDKSFLISESTLKSFKIEVNRKLLVGRGSGLALSFIAKGTIYEEAEKHDQLPIY